MKKLQLKLDDLEVTSFGTDGRFAARRGTIAGQSVTLALVCIIVSDTCQLPTAQAGCIPELPTAQEGCVPQATESCWC